MSEALKKVMNALTDIHGLRVYHYWREKMEAPFCVWAESGEGNLIQANNHKAEQAIDGYIDYFTRLEFDEMIDKIQQALNAVDGLGWKLNSVQFEEDTNLIHYEWRFSVIGQVGLQRS